ncbi:uncharacterized protein THITE_2112018 [Thermothielavioides terrestris NRRL 8126]|uniref:SH3 domain-containing protein n=1 Tax=Thermothielavioides terrestris (strain ATCC 38088 / NRRL 8126) TaxID=578455 RepID=G2R4J0_THETT|nr:uncharacterized protein THITE_2112018 [Thermothielavioides terrestris NRRL 8126]AEO65225.1 hypothetical protein THITE_2112018 [Thermothielavioides terrestris NRRL 8126]
MSLLPAESSLSGPAARSTPTPSTTTASTPAPPAPNSNSNNNNNPPSYAQSQTTAQPPALPARNQPPQPPAKPVLARARALYRYAAGDARDVSFERDDALAVFEYMNDDWWLGRNERTGEEGIFPRSYVVVVGGPAADDNGAGGAGEKVGLPPAGGGAVAAYNQQPPYQQGGYPGAGAGSGGGGGGGGYPVSPVPVGGYSAPPPPAGQAPVPYQDGQHGGGSKLGEQGKKFGKKLGNAAIFGAGATIGSNIVNSIF